MKERIKNKKGFTLVELLAVIVILGLLMAIAIPSVTKYITQSRIKTLVSTMDSYVTAVINQVNDGDYRFSDSTKVFAIPIECIALEKGGTDPFGNWMQANEAYWAYVLVHYDSENYNYEYGFTFKDDAGYGLYPTRIDMIENSMVRTGYDDLKQPENGIAKKFVPITKWEGFTNINDSTSLIVLEAESEGISGDGYNTCTLYQKGDNYEQVELEKNIARGDVLYFGKAYEATIDGIKYSYVFYANRTYDLYKDCTLSYSFTDSFYLSYYEGEIWDNMWMETLFKISEDKKSLYDPWDDDREYKLNLNSSCSTISNTTLKYNALSVFSDYREKVKTITFQNRINIPSSIPAEHKKDISREQNKKVMAYIVPDSTDSSYYNLYIQSNDKLYANTNSSYLFSMFTALDKINNLEMLDTSNVVDMQYMFYRTGYNSSKFTLDLGNNFDTSNVKNMTRMFHSTGYNDPIFTLDLGDKFNTSKVTDTSYMFYDTGRNSNVFTLDLGDKFDTSNVTDMYVMFSATGWKSPIFTLDLGDKFNTSKVKNMGSMFSFAGRNSPLFSLDCSNWNVDKVTSYSNFNYGVTSKVIPPVWKN